jgi:hypothetical protein
MTSNMKKTIAGTETMANRPKRDSEDMEKLMTDEVTWNGATVIHLPALSMALIVWFPAETLEITK